MKKLLKRIKKRPILIFTTIFFLLFIISSVCLIYSILRVSNIENILRYMICALIFVLDIYLLLGTIKITMKGKNIGIIAYDIIFLILFLIMCYSFVTINGLYDSISNMHKTSVNYSVSLISKDKKINIKESVNTMNDSIYDNLALLGNNSLLILIKPCFLMFLSFII